MATHSCIFQLFPFIAAPISKLGNIDELLQSIMPDKDLAEKINAFKAKKAKITAIAVP